MNLSSNKKSEYLYNDVYKQKEKKRKKKKLLHPYHIKPFFDKSYHVKTYQPALTSIESNATNT